MTTQPAPMQHTPWCDNPNDESHPACRVAVGEFGTGASVTQVALVKYRGQPTGIMIQSSRRMRITDPQSIADAIQLFAQALAMILQTG